MVNKTREVQVASEYYYNSYDTIDRFISYYFQIELVKNLKKGAILEVGIGNKTLTNYLSQNGFKVICCDFDANLSPDFVVDIRDLPYPDETFDIVLAFEVLEHIPWEDFEKALGELARVTKNDVIISLPYSSASFGIVVHFPLIQKLLKRPFVEIFFARLPYFFRRHKFNGEHYWEIGKRGFSLKKIKKILAQHFSKINEMRPILNPIHHFFILKKG